MDKKKQVIETITAEIAKMQKKQIVNELAKEVFASMRHRKFNKAVETAFKKAHPEYTVYYGKDSGSVKLLIWGNGIKYDDQVSYTLYHHGEKTDAEIWEHMDYDLQRNDLSDCIARHEAELQLLPALFEAEQQIEAIQKRIEAGAPAPSGHCLRQKNKQYSYEMQKLFPAVFA